MRPTLVLRLLLAALFALLASCASEPRDPSGSDHALLVQEPTFYVPESVWQMAPAGCEGLIDDEAVLAYAAGAPSLAVVLDEQGDPVCVDTWESIQIELDRLMGDPSPDPMRPVWAGSSDE